MPLVKTVPSQPEDPARRQQAAPRYPLEINWTGGDAGEFSQHREQRPSRLESVRVALTKPGTTTGNYRVFLSTVTNKSSITDTTVESLTQFGYFSCSIHQVI